MDKRNNKIDVSISKTIPAQDYRTNLQRKITEEFEYASDYYAVKRYDRTLLTWVDMEVRLALPYQPKEQSTIRDDYREILFKDFTFLPNLGDLYNFNNFYYMCIDTGKQETPTNNCLVERCNIELRFTDTSDLTSNIISVFGVSTSKLLNVNNTQYINESQGRKDILVPNDTTSKKIRRSPKPSRFLLGNKDWNNEYQAWVVEDIDSTTFVRIPYGSTTLTDLNGLIRIRLKLDEIKGKDNHTTQVAWQNWF